MIPVENILAKNIVTLFPHQQEALCALHNVLVKENESRASVITACGTGKTLLGRACGEMLGAKFIVLFAPTLGLISQTLNEWRASRSCFDNARYLCFCSDKTVASTEDSLCVNLDELACEVTTEEGVVKKFLNNHANETKVVFSTYQSSKKLCSGANGFLFDLLIYDEAHKTAGKEGREFSYPIFDSNINSKKRLFMSATPRIINEGVSMDDESIYGKIAYQLSFKNAVNRGIIVDSEILVSVISSDEVFNLIKTTKINAKDSSFNSDLLADIMALNRAVMERKVRKVITFHRSITEAKFFSEIVNSHPYGLLNDFNAYHINGGLSVKDRSRVLNQFENSSRAILTNVRCLTEGIDVPAIDMVGFLCAKKSKVDVIQAAGRATRKSEGKSKGFIFIPALIKGAAALDLETKVELSDFSDTLHVLKALSDSDESVNTFLYNKIISNERENINANCFDGRVKLLSNLEDVGPIEDAIHVKVLKMRKTWSFFIACLENNLEAFKQATNKSQFTTSSGVRLGGWVVRQVNLIRKGLLSKSRKERLESLGVNVEHFRVRRSFEETLEGDILRLRRFFSEREGFYVPCGAKYFEGLNVSVKVAEIRSRRRKGTLPQWAVDELESFGFIWELNNIEIDVKIAGLLEFYRETEEWTPPVGYLYKGRNIHSFVKNCRVRKKNGNLNKILDERLSGLGFEWEKIERSRECILNKHMINLREFSLKKTSSSSQGSSVNSSLTFVRNLWKKGQLEPSVSKEVESLGFTLDVKEIAAKKLEIKVREVLGYLSGEFASSKCKSERVLASIRRKKRENELPQWAVDMLDSAGFEWNPNLEISSKISLVKNYLLDKEGFKKSLAIRKSGKKININSEISFVRTKKKRGELPKWAADELDELGFVWEPTRPIEKSINVLLEYVAKNGWLIPAGTIYLGLNLPVFVSRIRRLKKDGVLEEEFFDKLDSAGFAWAVEKKKESLSLEVDLVASYIEEHGTLPVKDSFYSGKNAPYILTQIRRGKKYGVLSEYEIEKLDRLDFSWGPMDDEAKIKLLEQAFEEYGTWQLPDTLILKRKRIVPLFSEMRTKRNKGKLSPCLILQLDNLGFPWNSKENSYALCVDSLIRYYREYGEWNPPLDYIYKGKKMRSLIREVKGQYTDGTLKKHLIEKLNHSGFVLDPISLYERRLVDTVNLVVGYMSEFKGWKPKEKTIYNGCHIIKKFYFLMRKKRDGNLPDWAIES